MQSGSQQTWPNRGFYSSSFFFLSISSFREMNSPHSSFQMILSTCHLVRSPNDDLAFSSFWLIIALTPSGFSRIYEKGIRPSQDPPGDFSRKPFFISRNYIYFVLQSAFYLPKKKILCGQQLKNTGVTGPFLPTHCFIR
jgi:hypothetical protein